MYFTITLVQNDYQELRRLDSEGDPLGIAQAIKI